MSGSKATVRASAVVITGGLGVVVAGIVRNEPARAAGGACFTITALTLIALTLIRRWITDTSADRERMRTDLAAERERLRADECVATGERVKYLAAQAALGVERDRMRRDRAADVEGVAAQLAAERERLSDQFEEARNQVVQEASEAAWQIFLQGGLPVPAKGRTVLPFPSSAHMEPGAQVRGVSHPS